MECKILKQCTQGKPGDVVEVEDAAAKILIGAGIMAKQVETSTPTPEVPAENDEWGQLGRDLDESSGLPERWNVSRDNPPEAGKTLFGTVLKIGRGPFGRFFVAREKDADREYTVWEQSTLTDLMDKVAVNDKVAIRFDGLAKNPKGQTYVKYAAVCKKPAGEQR